MREHRHFCARGGGTVRQKNETAGLIFPAVLRNVLDKEPAGLFEIALFPATVGEIELGPVLDRAQLVRENVQDKGRPFRIHVEVFVVFRSALDLPLRTVGQTEQETGLTLPKIIDRVYRQPDSTVDAVFHEQLEKCQVDYFDFYLLHNVCENSLVFYNDPEIRIVEYLLKQKELGKIRHLGFSSHAVSAATIDEFLTRYEGVFEFVQIQLNYLDWILQDAKSKVEVIAKHGLKIVVMEGVRGGRLASLPEAQEARLRAARKDDSPARWALRWLQGIPEVAVILSGMSTMDQIIENVETFREHNPVSEAERALLTEVAESMLSWVPCTGCRYCTEGCPMGLEIPKIISAYNGVKNGENSAWYNPAEKGEAMDPARCIGCGNCTSICPQNIGVPGIMEEFASMLKERGNR